MDKVTFSNRLQEVTVASRGFAPRFVHNHLPDSNRYIVSLNQSCDFDLKPGEHVYPDDADPLAPVTATEVVDLLCRENRVPEWIDISVSRADSEHTYFQLLCCGRFTDEETLLYHHDGGCPPFNCKSPPLPPGWSDDQPPFDVNYRWGIYQQ